MKLWKYTISGNTPSKKNTRGMNTKTKRSYYSKLFLGWQESALWEIKAQKRPDTPILKTTEVYLKFWRVSMHTADNTNLAEGPMDVLVKMGVIKDDNIKVCPHTRQRFMGVDKSNPRVEIEITEE